MEKTNTLVVGQGIAGSVVAYMLHRKNIPFMVMDPLPANSASLVAAGMFTPISGKRKTIQAITLQQIPFAINVYTEIEKLLGTQLLHLSNIYQAFASAGERDELMLKAGKDDFARLINKSPELLPHIKQPFGAIEITASGWVDCEGFINGFREWLKAAGRLLEGSFTYDDLIIDTSLMQYGQMQFENIIFCEGYHSMDNPYFKEENIIPCSGDVLTIRCRDLPVNKIIKKSGIYLVPLGNETFKAGATYHWHSNDEIPGEEGRRELEQKLEGMLNVTYIITDHKTGIRPTTQNREVISKQHPVFKNMFMLNGLGTKGVIQGPWWANHLVDQYISGHD